MDTTSKKETSANGGKPKKIKLRRRFKYDILVFLQNVEREMLLENQSYASGILQKVIKELKNAEMEAGESRLQPDITDLLQEADKALLAKNPALALYIYRERARRRATRIRNYEKKHRWHTRHNGWLLD